MSREHRDDIYLALESERLFEERIGFRTAPTYKDELEALMSVLRELLNESEDT